MGETTGNSIDGTVTAGTVVQTGSIRNLYMSGESTGESGRYALPADIDVFVNRSRERDDVRRALELRRGRSADGGSGDGDEDEDAAGGGSGAGGGRSRAGDGRLVRPLTVSLTGIGGMGKSALGVRLGHELRSLCPDRALHADLDHARMDGAVDTSDVLQGLLTALGAKRDWVSGDLAGRTAQYRELTADKRLVLLLDNVRHAAEITPLLPPSADSVVFVISHQRLPELRCDVSLALEPLPAEHAVELLRGIVQDSRRSVDDTSFAEVARLCEGLPAALRVAGHRMRRYRRRRPDRLIAELRSELDQEGLPVVEAVWNAAYGELSTDAALLYRLLPGLPGPYVSLGPAAALLGADGAAGEDAAADALDELEDAGLLEPVARPEGEPGHGEDLLRMPDLLRAHAHRRRREEPGGGEAEAAAGGRRLVRWYRRQAERADRAQQRKRMRFASPVPPLPYAPDVPFADGGAAARWLEAERHALHGCVRLAHEAGDDTDAWGLCEPLWLQYVDHRHFGEAIDSFTLGLDAARRAGHLPAQVRMRCQLARALWELGDLEDAGKTLEPALRAAEVLQDGPLPDGLERAAVRKLHASSLEFSGNYSAACEKWATAADRFRASLRIHEEIGNAYGVLLQTYLLGRATAALGKAEEAARLLDAAHTMAQEQQHQRMTGRTAYELGRVLETQGAANRAVRLYDRALQSALARDADYEEAEIRRAWARLAETAGDTATADAHRAVVREYERRAGIVRPR